MPHIPGTLLRPEGFMNKDGTLWIIPLLSWFVLIVLAAWRDTARIRANIEHTYKLPEQVARNYSMIVTGVIYLPAYGFVILGAWLGERHQIGAIGVSCLWLMSPLWWVIGYLLTGGRSRTN